MRGFTLPELFGYDPMLLAALKPGRRRAVYLLAEAWIVSSVMLAAAVGYALWLVDHSLLVGFSSTIAMLLLVINLLRLVVAGSGAAPHLSEARVRDYRPALGPTLVLSMLAMLLAQPAQLPLWASELTERVEIHRAELLARQAEVSRDLGRPPDAVFRDELEHSAFLAFRVREIWKAPERAFSWSVLFWFLVLLPTIAGRYIALDALREYEHARWRAARKQIQEEGRAAAARVERWLSAFPTYRAAEQRALRAPFAQSRPFLSRAPVTAPRHENTSVRLPWWRRRRGSKS